MASDEELLLAVKQIKYLNAQLGLDANDDPVYAELTDSLRYFKRNHLEHLDERISVLQAASHTHKFDLEKIEYGLRLPENRGSRQDWEAAKERALKTETARQAHISALQQKMEMLTTAPSKLLLPLGTVVAVKEHASYEREHGPNLHLPVPGTVGVVTHYDGSEEKPVIIAVRYPIELRNGKQANADERYPSYFRFDPAELEVISYGLLPNGEPNEHIGYVPTHRVANMNGRLHDTDMVLEADGIFWNFKQGPVGVVEYTQIYKTMDEMNWLGEPIEPSGPSLVR